MINAIAILSVVASFFKVLLVFFSVPDLAATPLHEHYFTWITSGAFSVGWDFAVDKLTMIMLMIVTGASGRSFISTPPGTWLTRKATTASSLT